MIAQCSRHSRLVYGYCTSAILPTSLDPLPTGKNGVESASTPQRRQAPSANHCDGTRSERQRGGARPVSMKLVLRFASSADASKPPRKKSKDWKRELRS